MTNAGKKRELLNHWQRVAKLILAKEDVLTVSIVERPLVDSRSLLLDPLRGPPAALGLIRRCAPAAEHGLMQVELRRFVARGDRGVARRDQGAVAASLAAIHHGNRATACWKAHQ
jgi:hypothetical protein